MQKLFARRKDDNKVLLKMGFLGDLKKKTKNERWKKLELFKNQNLRKIFTKWDLRNHFQNSNRKKSKNITWPKGGHADHVRMGPECKY